MARAVRDLDCVIVGAGPAGIGTALTLSAVDGLRYAVVDRGDIGQTFLDWPKEQRFLTPSFTGNGFGATDLNAVHPMTSPAFSLGVDYPDGPEYASYLEAVADHFEVDVRTGTTVRGVRADGGRFKIDTDRGGLRARTVIWAAGEFVEPKSPSIPGVELADHSSTPAAWEPREGRIVVAGGYESGIDIACHHVDQGCDVTVIDPDHPWDARDGGADPSFLLAPRTRQRLRKARATGRLTLIGSARVFALRQSEQGFEVETTSGSVLATSSRPILATGFGPGLEPVETCFALRPDGWPLLDDNDESTTTPGVFLVGAALRHDELRFCFIYKFRQRYAQVAHTIANRLGRDASALESWRDAGMWTDDLSCCGTECAC